MTTQQSAAASPRPQLVAARDHKQVAAIGRMTGRQAGNSVKSFFESNKDALAAVLPRHMTPERVIRIAMTAMRNTPKLADCHVATFFGAIITCAQLGLEPNTPQGHIYLIPFENRRKGETEVQVVIGYKGLIDLARRSGQIVSLSARVICAKDTFSIDYGTEDRIVHAPYLGGDRGSMVGVYAVAKLKDGGVQFEFMTRAEIDAVRDGSQGYQTAKRFNKTDSPWMKHYDEMARKTVIRRLTKYLPMSIEMAGAFGADERTIGTETAREIIDGDFSVLDGLAVDEDAASDASEENDGQSAAPAVAHQPQQTADFDPATGEVLEPTQQRRADPSPAKAAAPKAAAPANKPSLPPERDYSAPGSLADDDDSGFPT
jgi:recombination protein RecT